MMGLKFINVKVVMIQVFVYLLIFGFKVVYVNFINLKYVKGKFLFE